MPTQEQLIAYLKDGMAKGATRPQLTEQLVAHGWNILNINEAFNALYTVPPRSTPPPPVPQTPVQSSPFAFSQVARTEPAASVSPVASAPVVETPQPSAPPAPISPTPPVSPHTGDLKKKLIIGVSALVVFLLLGGTAYAFVNKMGPFASLPYTESNLFSGLLARANDLKSSTYAVSGELLVEPRDKGAEPFTLTISNEGELREQYQNDSQRIENVSAILSELQNYSPSYPSTLRTLINSAKSRGSYYARTIVATDPVTKSEYSYATTEGGKNFELTVTFDVSANVSKIKHSYSYTATGTPIVGNTVTFTKDSYAYVYIPSEPPKPFLVEIGELVRFLPPELSAKMGVSAASEWKEKKADWKFNVNAEGDFGDLTYKIDVDALRKEDIYYFRINNLPSIFLGSLASVKGKWVAVDPSAATSTDSYRYSELTSLSSSIAHAEETYKKTKADSVEFVKKAVQFADEEQLMHFKTSPHSEKLNGHLVYRYDLEPNKDAIVRYYEKLVAEAALHPDSGYAEVFNDPGILDYLKSEEFTQMFEYLKENVSVTLWIDPKGYPARVEYSMRFVPPDTATQLKEKQIRLTWTTELTDINKSVDIKKPDDATPLQDLIKEAEANTYDYGPASTARLAVTKAKLAAVAVNAELAYDTNGGRYGAQEFPLGACQKTPNTLFGETSIYDAIASASGDDASTATCVATQSTFAVSVPLPDLEGYAWCIDSTGARKQISSALVSAVCP